MIIASYVLLSSFSSNKPIPGLYILVLPLGSISVIITVLLIPAVNSAGTVPVGTATDLVILYVSFPITGYAEARLGAGAPAVVVKFKPQPPNVQVWLAALCDSTVKSVYPSPSGNLN